MPPNINLKIKICQKKKKEKPKTVKPWLPKVQKKKNRPRPKRNEEKRTDKECAMNNEFEKLVGFNIDESLQYESNAIVKKHILNEKTGNILAMAVDYGKVFKPKPSPFSTLIHIIAGKAEVVVNNSSMYLQNNESMIIPGHTSYTVEANQKFKMLSVILKSGYDGLDI